MDKFLIDWQVIVHYFFHLVFPFIIAKLFASKNWVRIGIIMLLTMAVDLDHLLANPVFDPLRCSINFHPLHSYWAIGIYFAGLFYKKTRWVATGLILHMATDFADCLWLFSKCGECLAKSSISHFF